MPVYANTSGFADQRRHPNALIFIVGAHAVAIAAVMMAKMDVIPVLDPVTTTVELIEEQQPPKPEPPKPTPETKEQVQPRDSAIDRPKVEIPTPSRPDAPAFDDVRLPPQPMGPGPIGTGQDVVEKLVPKPPVFVAGRFNTPERLIEPPYPADKQRLEEEAVLRLKLSIDERGRVTAVEPIGRVDRSFLEAARRHLIANWRYKPATEDGKAVPWSTTISLTFRIE